VYKRQIYQIAESNLIESKLFSPELECSTSFPLHFDRLNFGLTAQLRSRRVTAVWWFDGLEVTESKLQLFGMYFTKLVDGNGD